MDEKNVATLWEDLTGEFYVLAQAHSDEIRKMLEVFDDDQLQFSIELEAYKKDRKKPKENEEEQVFIEEEDDLIVIERDEQPS